MMELLGSFIPTEKKLQVLRRAKRKRGFRFRPSYPFFL